MQGFCNLRIMRLLSLIFFFLFLFGDVLAQPVLKDSLVIQLFAEVYASSIPNKPFNKERPGFFYNYTKANNAGINLALARMHYRVNRFRTNIGLMAGDYPTANLSGEKSIARYIYELNAGYKLSKKEELWLDVGVLPSHIGIESAIGKDNWTATRSIVADNSPYYETGIRVSYKPNEHLYFAMLTLNGWQRITAPIEQLGANWGMQISWSPNASVTINSSSFIGKVPAGPGMATRIYSDLFSTIAFSQKAALTLGWDIGLQAATADTLKTVSWNSFVGLFRYQLKPGKLSAALRYERFVDDNNILFSLSSNRLAAFNTHHASINVDWQPVKTLLLRAEAGYLSSPNPLFYKGNNLVKQQFNSFLILSYNFVSSK